MEHDGPRIIAIQSLSDPRIADYANLRDRQLRRLDVCSADEGGVFMAEGELVVRQLVESGLGIRSVLLTPQRLETVADLLPRLSPFTPVYLVEQKLMNEVVGFNIHRGILAAGQRPRAPDLGQLLAAVRALVVLENLANHDNVGGIFRATAALAGLPRLEEGGGPRGAAVLLSPQSCDPFYRKAIRVSMGMALRVPSATLDPFIEGLEGLKAAGFTLLALTPAADAVEIGDLAKGRLGNPGVRPALILGAEGAGLSPGAMEAADVRVRIPIDPGVDSLNVVTAAAIALHALRADSAGSG